jgi:hypothetical protein
MVCIILHSMLVTLCKGERVGSVDSPHLPIEVKSKVFQAKLSNLATEDYHFAVLRLIAQLEYEQNFKIKPTVFPQIAVKFDVQRAPGLSTNLNLLFSIVQFLERRGYTRENIFLVALKIDRETRRVLEKQFLPSQIITGEDEGYFHPDWFHDSPMPPAMGDRAKLLIDHPKNHEIRTIEERKSYLPSLLFLSKMYWINLSTAKDDHVLGIDGAITNATLNSSSNAQRFREDVTMGPAAATEILAIPEFSEKHLFSMVDLSEMQIAGGPEFNAEFIRQKPSLLVSKNPVFIDYFAMQSIQKERAKLGLKDRAPQDCKLFIYARELSLGDIDTTELVKLPD